MLDIWLKNNGRRLSVAVVVAIYIRFLLLPTAILFFEAYHLLQLEFLYIGYQLFKVIGYIVSVWEYRNLAAVVIAVFIFLIALVLSTRISKRHGKR